VRQKEQGLTRRLVGISLDGRRVPRHDMPLESAGAAVGRVTSGTFSPSLERPIGMAYVESGLAKLGHIVEVRAGETRLPATIVKRPFWTKGSNRGASAS
jgi:aminomethyltransferase